MRSSLTTPRLARLLADPAGAPPAAPGMDFAERLGLSLNAFDAIALQGAQRGIRAVPGTPVATSGAASALRAQQARALAEDLQRARGTLAGAIAQDPLALAAPPPLAHPRLAAPRAEPPADPGYAPFQQRHAELQRQMAQMVSALRDHVRQALGRMGPHARQLALLDATMEQVLAAREQALLPAIGTLLEQRFRALRAEHAGEAPPEGGTAPWLAAFRAHWHEVLRAELDLRLEPVAGLVEAATQDWTHPA